MTNEENMSACFVYHNNEKIIKVLDLEDAKSKHDELVKEGWKHTATIDPCLWIENLYNNKKDAFTHIAKLGTI